MVIKDVAIADDVTQKKGGALCKISRMCELLVIKVPISQNMHIFIAAVYRPTAASAEAVWYYF